MQGIYNKTANAKLPYFAEYLPHDYFECLQSPLINILFGKGTELRNEPLIADIANNAFYGNYLV
jgi:hypothetical protein